MRTRRPRVDPFDPLAPTPYNTVVDINALGTTDGIPENFTQMPYAGQKAVVEEEMRRLGLRRPRDPGRKGRGRGRRR